MMPRILYALFLGLLAALMPLAGVAQDESAETEQAASAEEAPDPRDLEGKPAPNAKLTTLDGSTFDLAAHKGKDYVVLDFWATWCPWCRSSSKQFEKLADQYSGKNVAFYMINVGEEAGAIKKYLEKNAPDATIVPDPEWKLSESYRVDYIPHIVVIDPEGKIVEVAIGEDNVKEALDTTLGEIFGKPEGTASK